MSFVKSLVPAMLAGAFLYSPAAALPGSASSKNLTSAMEPAVIQVATEKKKVVVKKQVVVKKPVTKSEGRGAEEDRLPAGLPLQRGSRRLAGLRPGRPITGRPPAASSSAMSGGARKEACLFES